MNTLAANVTNSATSFTVTYDLYGIQRGTIISIGLEDIYVFTVDANSKTVSACKRGYNGTTAASHTAGDMITVRPKFTNFRILEAINNDLKDLSSPYNGLYQVKTLDITFNPVRYGYDLTGVTDIIGIAELRYRLPGPQRTWPVIDNYALLRNMDVGTAAYDDFPSDLGLVIYEGAFPGLPIHVRYKAQYGQLSTLTDDVATTTGLQAFALDLPPLGAAMRLIAGREVRRNFSEVQGEPRRAEEVPAGAELNSMRNLGMLRQQRINACAAHLAKQYPNVLVGA